MQDSRTESPPRPPHPSGRPASLRSPTALCAAGALAAALVGLSCGGQEGEKAAAGSPEQLRSAGVARVGFANEAPYAYVDTETGRLTGEAPEIARVVLERMGVEEIEGVLTEFGSLIPGLKAGRFDLIAAGMYITPARCREIDFSRPTYSVGGAFLVREGNPRDLHGYDDVVAGEDVRLGVIAGAVERGYALRTGVPRERLATFPDPPSAVAGLLAGRVDAFAATVLTARDLLEKSGDRPLELAEPFRDPVFDGVPARGYGAFGFHEDADALRRAFDAQLEGFLGTEEHLALVRPFGFTREMLPGDVTAAELCQLP